ncbi:MAG: zf-HC2 domain-containing protein [Anaerolineae bacterium]|nr:zf-HC2 domain-containing protein [Anaerolineae bacterium]
MLRLIGRVRDAGHGYCQENLSALLDGQLSPQEEERVRCHLAECEECQRDLRALERTIALVRALPQVRAPRSFQISPTTPVPSVPFWMRPWAYTALRTATGVAAALLVVTLTGSALTMRHAGRAPAFAEAEPAALMAAPEAPAVGLDGELTTPRELGQETPPTRGEKLAPAATPEAPGLGGEASEALEPTLTAEELARRAAAPPGAGELPVETSAPGIAALAAPAPTDTAATAGDREVPVAATPAQPQEEPGHVPAERYGQERPAAPGLAAYPWRAWAVASGMLVAVFLALTLRLRAIRSRWP